MIDLRVLELSQSVAGAYTGRLLATAGADVTLVESLEGSALRRMPPLLHGQALRGQATGRSALFEYLAAWKQSVALDADHPAGQRWLDELIDRADVVISSADENPETAHGFDTRIRARNPELVHVLVSRYGASGPWSGWSGSDLCDWAASGYLYISGDPARAPVQGAGPWSAYVAGVTAAVGALAALHERQNSGRGQLVDVGTMEAMAASHQWSFVQYSWQGVVKRRANNRHADTPHPVALFPCRDGWVCIAAPSPAQWRNLCAAIGMPEMADDPRFGANAPRSGRADHADEIDQRLAPWLMSRSRSEVVDALQGHHVPASAVLSLDETLDDEQLRERDFWVSPEELGAGARMPGLPFRLPSSPSEFRAAPRLGQHTAEVLGEAGCAPTELRQLVGDGVLLNTGSRPLVGEPRPTPIVRATRPTRTEASAPRLLEGIRVVEFGYAWAGPLAARTLGDLGADVIKVEQYTTGAGGILPRPNAPGRTQRSGSQPHAGSIPAAWNRGGSFTKMNRNKRGLCADLKTPEGKQIWRRLVESADVVLDNFSPRGSRSLGIDHATIREWNPRIISISATGYGHTGPLQQRVSYGPILEAHSGATTVTGYPGAGPLKLGHAFPDPVGGMHTAFALIAALAERERTGEGMFVDISQLETYVGISGELALLASLDGSPEQRANRDWSAAPQGVYPCLPAGEDAADGLDVWIAITIDSDEAWLRFCEVIDDNALRNPEWINAPGRRADHDQIDALISSRTARLERFALAERLQAAGVPAMPVLTNRDLFNNRQLRERGFVVDWDQPGVGTFEYAGSPLHFSDAPDLAMRPSPALGQHNREILSELGFSAAEVAQFESDRAIVTAPPLSDGRT